MYTDKEWPSKVVSVYLTFTILSQFTKWLQSLKILKIWVTLRLKLDSSCLWKKVFIHNHFRNIHWLWFLKLTSHNFWKSTWILPLVLVFREIQNSSNQNYPNFNRIGYTCVHNNIVYENAQTQNSKILWINLALHWNSIPRG